MVVEYDKYVGHHQDHLYLMNELAYYNNSKKSNNGNDDSN